MLPDGRWKRPGELKVFTNGVRSDQVLLIRPSFHGNIPIPSHLCTPNWQNIAGRLAESFITRSNVRWNCGENSERVKLCMAQISPEESGKIACTINISPVKSEHHAAGEVG